MRVSLLAVALAITSYFGGVPAVGAYAAKTAPTPKSATKARDIDGIVLGTPISEIRNKMRITYIGNGQYDGKAGDLSYNFQITPLGRVYRISTTQKLGRFNVDFEFNRRLNAKLAAKYGIPAGGIERRHWELVETISGAEGQQGLFRSNWFSVVVLSGLDGVDLSMTMLDFRYLWADNAKVNRQSRDEAVAAFSF